MLKRLLRQPAIRDIISALSSRELTNDEEAVFRSLCHEALEHATASLPGGGMVMLLDTGAFITPEDEAMLQSLHSRDPRGILEHLKKLSQSGSGKFMEQFYVGYGHKSIGDCGSLTLFIEGVSMLAAKAVQDWLLYSGQECSTRYIEFSNQRFINPLNSAEGSELQEKLRSFYLYALEPVKAHLRAQFAKQDDEKESVYEKAISARAFDILRSWLPAGASTNLSWHANLRQTADKLIHLRHHPLAEVQAIGAAMEEVLCRVYPNSFSHKRYEATESYYEKWMSEQYYYTGSNAISTPKLAFNGVDKLLLAEYRQIMLARPPKTELPKALAECGMARFDFLLDFGSYRDIQRQRAVIQRMPFLSTNFGFHPWYLQELPGEVRDRANALLKDVIAGCEAIKAVNPAESQYYVPMGFQVPCRVSGDLSALVYLVELRSTVFVHPTLQSVAKDMAKILKEEFGQEGLQLYVDWQEAGRFDVRRGKQDIQSK